MSEEQPVAIVVKPPPAIWRRVGEGLAGAGFAFIVWSIIGPDLLHWWYEPPVKELVSCAPAVRVAVHQFVVVQGISAVMGAVTFLVARFFIARWWAKRKAGKATEAAKAP